MMIDDNQDIDTQTMRQATFNSAENGIQSVEHKVAQIETDLLDIRLEARVCRKIT